MRKLIAISLILALAVGGLTGCKKQPAVTTKTATEPIELTYYRLFDGEDIFEPIIKEYESENKNVTINYRKFTDPEKYIDLIINELAEGEGPDIFSMQNSWFTQHRKKLSPAPSTLVTPDIFRNTFVSVAADDLIMPDENGAEQVYGLPLYVDTLALYYNQDQFEDAIPSQGKPSTTWEGIQEDVYKLTKSDNSFERFEVAGIAMGRSDNILRAIDILYLLMIQFGTEFYDAGYTEATFADKSGANSLGLDNPGVEALTYFTQFALPSSKYYTWNSYLADKDSAEKEIKTFARGKVSMIIGYSYLYQDILDQIEELDKKGQKTIDKSVVKVTSIPQVEDPETSTDKRDTYASYFAETVSRTSKHSDEAWKFLTFLVQKENLEHYHSETHRPTSRRDMIDEQSEEAIYGVFADQIGYAESFAIANAEAYNEIFTNTINDVVNTADPEDALKTAQEEINLYIPSEGLYPAPVTTTP